MALLAGTGATGSAEYHYKKEPSHLGSATAPVLFVRASWARHQYESVPNYRKLVNNHQIRLNYGALVLTRLVCNHRWVTMRNPR